MELRLEGILSANVTPFKQNYDLDEAGLRKLIRFQAKPEGITGIVCNAGAGEGATLTRGERVRVIEIIGEEMASNQRIIAGIEALSTREAVEQTKEAKAAGAAAIMLTPPHVYDWSATANPAGSTATAGVKMTASPPSSAPTAYTAQAAPGRTGP